MPLERLEHFLVLTDDLEKTKRFYVDLLGMVEGFRPRLEFSGYWLYVEGAPCLHLGDWASYIVWTKQVGIPVSARAPGTGPVDHIAFNATDYEGMRARLESRGIALSANHLDEIGLRQLFFHDPNGVAIELNFRTEG